MITIDETFATTTLRDLVRINSINPSLVPGAPGEREIAAHTANVMRSLGLDVHVHEAAPGRPSVVGIRRGTGGGRSLMLNAHYDTVGVDGMSGDPFSGDVRGGKLYGRGAYDMKGSLAGCIAAVKALIDADVALAGDLMVAAVADEEEASLGTQDLIQRYHVSGAIVTEPTALQICLAHKGFVWVEVTTTGRAAHGSKPDLGVDANLRMGHVLTRLAFLEESLRGRPPHPLVGSPSVHAATLRGGTGWSTYAAECRLGIERRTVPGESESSVLAEMRSMVDPLARANPTFAATVTHKLTREPFEASASSALVQNLADAVRVVREVEPVYIGETPWMDASLLAAAGVDTVVYGPDGGGAHSAQEWVDLATVYDLARVLAGTAMRYCGGRA